MGYGSIDLSYWPTIIFSWFVQRFPHHQRRSSRAAEASLQGIGSDAVVLPLSGLDIINDVPVVFFTIVSEPFLEKVVCVTIPGSTRQQIRSHVHPCTEAHGSGHDHAVQFARTRGRGQGDT